MRIRLYGGPCHGEITCTDKDRFEMVISRAREVPSYLTPIDTSTPLNRYDITTYYVRMYREDAITVEGSRVYREMRVGMWEQGEVLDHDLWELRHDLQKKKWKWPFMPSFINEFEAWWELKMYQATGKSPVRRW